MLLQSRDVSAVKEEGGRHELIAVIRDKNIQLPK